jgi:hypothetical protein
LGSSFEAASSNLAKSTPTLMTKLEASSKLIVDLTILDSSTITVNPDVGFGEVGT